MNSAAFDLRIFHRLEERTGDHISRHESFSSDFLLNGTSAVEMLVKIFGGNSDYMGCFARQWDDLNRDSESQLLLKRASKLASGRTPLYVCPECGDLGCGAMTVRVSKIDSRYIWDDFAYQNGYEDPRPILGVGPLCFEESNYENVIARAAAL